jgi:hypothetical protein
MTITAKDNVSLLETITRGGPLAVEPSPAARAYFAEKLKAIRQNPTAHSAFFLNAWIPWRTAFENPREWESYADKLAVRHVELGAQSIMLDAHDVPGSVTNNPNDPQNQLRFERYRPNYRQDVLWENRDEFTPITIDTREIMRLFAEGGPDSTNVSDFASSQITMAVNADRAREFHTLMLAIGTTAAQPNLFHVQIPDIMSPTATEAQARLFASLIRTQVLALADFTNYFSPAQNTQTVPKSQVRLVIRQSVMQRLGSLAYATAFNPEYVFALPEDQIVELPDHYFDRQPALSDKAAFIVDHGTDSKYGSLVLVDTYHDWGVDRFDIKDSENRALHHASILGTNPYKTFVTVGTGKGTQVINPAIVPATITGGLYGPDGDIPAGGDLVRGKSYSTTATVVDSSGYPAGGWVVDITSPVSSPSGSTTVGLYNAVTVGLDEPATSITVTFKSLLDSSKTVTRTYNVVGTVAAIDGTGILVTNSAAPVFAPGTGAGGTITYTLATGEVAEISSDGGATWTTAGTSPIAVPTKAVRSFRKRTAQGYVYPEGVGTRVYGPYTAA